jgi:hypothetical protein
MPDERIPPVSTVPFLNPKDPLYLVVRTGDPAVSEENYVLLCRIAMAEPNLLTGQTAIFRFMVSYQTILRRYEAQRAASAPQAEIDGFLNDAFAQLDSLYIATDAHTPLDIPDFARSAFRGESTNEGRLKILQDINADLISQVRHSEMSLGRSAVAEYRRLVYYDDWLKRLNDEANSINEINNFAREILSDLTPNAARSGRSGGVVGRLAEAGRAEAAIPVGPATPTSNPSAPSVSSSPRELELTDIPFLNRDSRSFLNPSYSPDDQYWHDRLSEFLKSQYADDLLEFAVAVQQLRALDNERKRLDAAIKNARTDPSLRPAVMRNKDYLIKNRAAIDKKLQEIRAKFLDSVAPRPLNLSPAQKQRLKDALNADVASTPGDRTAQTEAMMEIQSAVFGDMLSNLRASYRSGDFPRDLANFRPVSSLYLPRPVEPVSPTPSPTPSPSPTPETRPDPAPEPPPPDYPPFHPEGPAGPGGVP